MLRRCSLSYSLGKGNEQSFGQSEQCFIKGPPNTIPSIPNYSPIHFNLSAMVQYFFSQNKTAIDGLSAAETISQTTRIRCFGFSKFIAFAMHLDIYLIETKLDFL
jgi:hypothetical protein